MRNGIALLRRSESRVLVAPETVKALRDALP